VCRIKRDVSSWEDLWEWTLENKKYRAGLTNDFIRKGRMRRRVLFTFASEGLERVFIDLHARFMRGCIPKGEGIRCRHEAGVKQN